MNQLTDKDLEKYIEILEKTERDTAGLLGVIKLDWRLAAMIGETQEHVVVLHSKAQRVLEQLLAEQERRHHG